ncbi:hypothetical protein [Allomesorhizobium alhagi]|jgi:hypothetical protein|uniref:Transmembrane protein n=1 Tax=Mesorhizobium alhagi CCNWXJ12-2 TaxID=1107882 RepID=H0HK24_9HYPH|nr:hypothetical protein [Mesorhizobium alhagi]EHK58916.1 hypothetical protein MAXJ12_02576 [Mesorhizobium alhagi CCNWXJ12-2]
MATSDSPLISVGGVQADETSYVDWPAIFAGTIFATAISFVLLAFGSALGLSLASPYEGSGISLFWFSIVAALWLLWVQISSFIAGGYLTGRLRRRKHDATEDESDIRDGSHGLIVWALGALIGAFIAVSGISGVASTAATSMSTIAAGGAGAAAEGEDPLSGAYDLLVDRFLRSGDPAAPPASAEARDEIGRVLAAAVADGALNDADRQYLTTTIAARAGLDEAQAQQRVDALLADAQAAEAEARQAAETARKVAMIAAFVTAASFLVSAVGAYYGATLGGNHRDNQIVFADWRRPW